MTDRYLTLSVTLDTWNGASHTTLANCQDIVATITGAFPTAKITWLVDDGFLDDTTGSWGTIRTYLAARVAAGDAVGYWRRFGFPAAVAASENADLTTYIGRTVAIGNGPPLLAGWYVPHEMLAHARTNLGVKTAIAQSWAQHGDDGYFGDGAPNCPYYPSVNHTLIPAQAEANRIDLLVLDSLSADLFGAAANTRKTVDPLDAGTLTRMQQISASYLDDTYSPGPIRWVNHHAQLDYLYDPANSAVLTRYNQWVAWLGSTYPTAHVVNIDAFGTAWRAAHPVNDFAIVHCQTDPAGSGDVIYWLHTAQGRRAVKRTSAGVVTLLDLVRYADATAAPACPSLSVEPPIKVSMRDAAHPTNPYGKAAFRELSGLWRSFSALAGQDRVNATTR